MDIFVANTHPKLISYNEDLKYTGLNNIFKIQD
jgi:hypothetical protein